MLVEVEPEDDVVVLPVPVGVLVVLPVVEVEPDDVVVLPVPAGVLVLPPAAEGVEVAVPAEAPAELGVELELGAPAVDDESGVTCWEVLAVDVAPPPAFPPQPKAVVRTARHRQQPSNGAEKFLITYLPVLRSVLIPKGYVSINSD